MFSFLSIMSIPSGPKLTLPVDADEEQVVDGDDAQGQHEGVSQATQLWANEKPQFQKEAHGAGHEAHQQVGDGEAADDQVGGAAQGRGGPDGHQHQRVDHHSQYGQHRPSSELHDYLRCPVAG